MSLHDSKGRFWFLRVNRLFETTPLTGYAFIADSKTYIEVIFWYGVIITMTVMTLVNVHAATINYLSKPTKTYVTAASSTENTTIADLNFVLNTSLIEFSQVNPTGLSYSDHEMVKMVVQQLACNVILPTKYDFETTAIVYVLVEWIESLVTSWSMFGPKGHERKTVTHLSDNKILNQWFDELSTRGSDLFDYFWKNRFTEIPSEDQYSSEYGEFIAEALALFDGPLKRRSKYMPYYLLLLKGIQNNNDPRRGFFECLKEYVTHSLGDSLEDHDFMYATLFYKASERIQAMVEPLFNGQNGSKFDSTATKLLEELDMTASEVLGAVYEGLDEMIHISIESDNREASIPIYLTDWDYEAMSWKAPSEPGKLQKIFMEGWQMLRLKLKMPENSNKNHISIHSYLFVWYYHIINAFQKFFDEMIDIQTKMSYQQFLQYEDKLFQYECKTKLENLGNFDAAELLDFIQNLYASRTSLTLENERGSGIDMEPFRIYTITVKPTMQFYSRIEACEPNSQENCLDECLAKSYEETCGCIPWMLHHIKSEPLCNFPCLDSNQPNACKEHCRRQLEHPCALSLYQFETASRPMAREISPDQPMFEIEMRKAEVFNHPHFIEEYEMTIGDFTAQLGGLMEFWIGLNVIGILHIFVYVFKQILKSRIPTPQAAKKSIAHFFNGDNKIDVHSDTKSQNQSEFCSGDMALDAKIEDKFKRFAAEMDRKFAENNAKINIEFRKAIAELEQKFSAGQDLVIR